MPVRVPCRDLLQLLFALLPCSGHVLHSSCQGVVAGGVIFSSFAAISARHEFSTALNHTYRPAKGLHLTGVGNHNASIF